ncbi:MAG: hypothetical protein J7K09_09360 [Desulfuromusa sp.]|nr:hypothetical protein [Desulfuromusa sp.]
MGVDEQDVPESADRPAEGLAADRSTAKKKRLELLLIDDPDHVASDKHIVDREVKVFGEGTKNLFALLIVLILFCALVLGICYYFLNRLPLSQLPENQQSYYVSPRLPVPERPKTDNSAIVTAVESGKKASVVSSTVNLETPLFTVTVGPFINDVDLQQAIGLLHELGLSPQRIPGRGQVTMIRLLEGVYPAAEARNHLEKLKKTVKSAFLLPMGDKLAVYAGSFHQEKRAREMQKNLAHELVKVSLVDIEVNMNGTLLAALQADQQTASEVAAHISSLGLSTQILEQK